MLLGFFSWPRGKDGVSVVDGVYLLNDIYLPGTGLSQRYLHNCL